MNILPTISSYGQYSSDNYGAHTLRVDMGEFELFYSYETIVAYRSVEDGLVVSKNNWGTTTGRHLNFICSDKKSRLPYSEFRQKLDNMLTNHIVPGQ